MPRRHIPKGDGVLDSDSGPVSAVQVSIQDAEHGRPEYYQYVSRGASSLLGQRQRTGQPLPGWLAEAGGLIWSVRLCARQMPECL